MGLCLQHMETHLLLYINVRRLNVRSIASHSLTKCVAVAVVVVSEVIHVIRFRFSCSSPPSTDRHFHNDTRLASLKFTMKHEQESDWKSDFL